MISSCWCRICAGWRSARCCAARSAAILSSDKVSELFAEIKRLPLRTMASRGLCVSAMQVSQEHGISVHGAICLALAPRGERIVLSRHGKPIAQLVPQDPSPRRHLGFLQASVDDQAFLEPLPDDELVR